MSSFWSVTVSQINPPTRYSLKKIFLFSYLIFRIKRFINYIDDTASPMLRNRNTPVSRPQSPPPQDAAAPPSPLKSPFKSIEEKVSDCLFGGEVIDLDKLKKLSWNGIPSQFRPLCWKILMVPIYICNT